MCNNCYITIYEHLLAIRNIKSCLTSRYDYMIVIYYFRSNKQLPLFFTACSSYYIIQHIFIFILNKTLFYIVVSLKFKIILLIIFNMSLNDIETLRNDEALTLTAYKVFTISQSRDNLDAHIYNNRNISEKIN